MSLGRRKIIIQNYIDSVKNKKFVWGVHDCHTLVHDLLDLLYKDNKLTKVSYKTKQEAQAVQRKISWHKELERCFYTERVGRSQAYKHDLLLYISYDPVNNFECMHIVFENNVYFLIEGNKLIKIGLAFCQSISERNNSNGLIAIEGIK